MLTDAMETALFVSVFMWPIALPLLLGALGCSIYLIVYAIKNWKKRSVRIGAGVAAVCVLLFAGVLGVERQPYSESAARRLYERHQEAYDTVGAYLLEEGGSYWTSLREEWPEEIAAELGEVLTTYLRCGSSHVSADGLDGGACRSVLFEIYIGPESDSGDGGPAQELQYLAYSPDRSSLNGGDSDTKSLTHLTGDWYLYKTVDL